MSDAIAGTVQTYAAVLSAISTAIGLLFIYLQIRGAAKTARSQNAMPFLLGDQTRRLRAELNSALQGIFDTTSNEQLDPDAAGRVDESKDAVVAVKSLMNYYEAIACAINHRAIDEELYRAYSSRTLRMTFWQFANWVKAVRGRDTSPNAYVELERLAVRWDRHPLVNQRFFDKRGRAISAPYQTLFLPASRSALSHFRGRARR